MLYWICPECGHECSPAIRECPTCTAPPAAPAVRQAAASQELLSLAKNFQSASSVAVLAPPAAVAVKEPVKPALAEPEPELSDKLASLDGLTVKAARPGRSEPANLPPAPIPVRISSPAAPSAAFPPSKCGFQPAALKPAGEISFQAARSGRRNALKQPTEPLPSRRQSVAFVRVDLPAAERSAMAFADLAQLVRQPDDELRKPVPAGQNGQPSNGVSTPQAYKPGDPSLIGSQLKLSGESLAELLNALKISAEELDREAIHQIQASFSEPPAVALLAAPAEIVTPPAPAAAQWMRSQKPAFTAIAPEHSGRTSLIAGPQAPPLAGPSLPPQLLNFDHQNSSLRGRKRKSGWPVSLLVGTIVILGAGSVFQFMTQNRDTKVAAAPAPVEIVKSKTAPPVRVVEEHPAARSVEVAGVRIVMGPNKRPQLQYIAINHSATEIMGLNIRIAVRSVEDLGGPPLFSVSSIVAFLGPNQSKEVRADLDPSIAPASIPDWHSLRTEVLIARQ
jgi:hypothetical protein